MSKKLHCAARELAPSSKAYNAIRGWREWHVNVFFLAVFALDWKLPGAFPNTSNKSILIWVTKEKIDD
jgi:hypothetical protein